ncbi:polynucleotide adenylyltransferase [Aidingimonas lacisalsi]|uniref:polynucleotide adenylyltransferase n=1 Tax=Aidingimonas lacisalsi TaxID=2604086 RepID=UPI0011D26DE1|nr:polynucleotide adenylyltransferase [Aidingimonas lacisalsi]
MNDRMAGLDVYRVGGAVRDKHLGWPVYDNDWVVVGATPKMMERRGFKPVGRDFPVFLHPETHEEYALARTERKQGRGYTGFQVQASPDVTLEDDLRRRDLTCNAMAETPDGTLIDPYGGLADLQHKVLRHVSPAFVEDPLRVLRTARFLARYRHMGFSIAVDTLALMRELVANGEMAYLVAERVWTETDKALGELSPHAYFQALMDCHALSELMPELTAESMHLEDALARMLHLPELDDSDDDGVKRWRWARLCEHLDDDVRQSLQQRLRVPNAYADQASLAALTRRFRHASGTALPDAHAVFQWLNDIDAWRRGERVAPQLRLIHLTDEHLAQVLSNAWAHALQIQPRDLVEAGYKGKALGDALAERRRAAIDEALHARDREPSG